MFVSFRLPLASRCSELAFRLIINLTSGSKAWSDRISNNSHTILIVIRLSMLSFRNVLSAHSIEEDETIDGENDTTQTMDCLCLGTWTLHESGLRAGWSIHLPTESLCVLFHRYQVLHPYESVELSMLPNLTIRVSMTFHEFLWLSEFPSFSRLFCNWYSFCGSNVGAPDLLCDPDWCSFLFCVVYSMTLHAWDCICNALIV
jgi:hypothetical protein